MQFWKKPLRPFGELQSWPSAYRFMSFGSGGAGHRPKAARRRLHVQAAGESAGIFFCVKLNACVEFCAFSGTRLAAIILCLGAVHTSAGAWKLTAVSKWTKLGLLNSGASCSANESS